jgi:hypothetical protein
MPQNMASPPSHNPQQGKVPNYIEQRVLKLFEVHGWAVTILALGSCSKLTATRENVSVQIAVLNSGTAISNEACLALVQQNYRVFYDEPPPLNSVIAPPVAITAEPLSEFFPYLVSLNKRIEPDKSPAVTASRPKIVKRLVAESPLQSVLSRLEQFTSANLAAKLVARRAAAEQKSLTPDKTKSKATGIAYLMRNALDYAFASQTDQLNKRVVSLYYGTMALAQAEMLAAPSGPADLDEIENMTKFGHGLYTVPHPDGGFSAFQVGVLATGFLSHWAKFLGKDVSKYPHKKAKSIEELQNSPENMSCSLRDLFASIPEIDDLFAEVFAGTSKWITVMHDQAGNDFFNAQIYKSRQKQQSTYMLFNDESGGLSAEILQKTNWPLAEIRPADNGSLPGISLKGITFRARVDHSGQDRGWDVLPVHSSSFGKRGMLLLPVIGGLSDYRAVAVVTLYALSIMARYMPSAWRRIEDGDENQYLALVKTALSVWERLLPEEFLESIAGEQVYTAQPGSWL